MRTIDIMPISVRWESASFGADVLFAVSGIGVGGEFPDSRAKRLASVQRGGNGADVHGMGAVNMRFCGLRGI